MCYIYSKMKGNKMANKSREKIVDTVKKNNGVK